MANEAGFKSRGSDTRSPRINPRPDPTAGVEGSKKTDDSFHGIAPQQYPFHCILHVTCGAYAT